MKKVIILYSVLMFDFLTYSDALAWQVEVDKVTPANSAVAFAERLNALEALAGSGEVDKYTARWFVKKKWKGNQQCLNGCRNGRNVVGQLWAPNSNLENFKNDLRKIQERINLLNDQRQPEAENARKQREAVNARRQPGAQNTQDQPEAENAQRQPGAQNARKQREAVNARRQPGAENTQDQPEAENAQDQPEAENAQGQPEAENARRQLGAENTQDQPEAENAQGQREAENAQGQREAENAQGQPEDQDAQRQPEAQNAQSQPEAENAQGQCEAEALKKQESVKNLQEKGNSRKQQEYDEYMRHSNEYLTEEEELNAIDEEIAEEGRQEAATPSENNETDTNGWDSTCPDHYRKTLWFDDETLMFDI
jgi:hypothetical protein